MPVQNRIADRYELKEPLGEGGMGLVFRAFDTKTRSYVAIKTMRDASDPLAVEMFTKEWSVLAGISHPNIVEIRDVGEIDDGKQRRPFFVMPLLQGATLAKLIESSSARLTVERVVGIVTQVCRGLQAAHEQGIVHRDLKPSNIFVMSDDSARIIDFGVVYLAGSHSVSGHKGTWQYMAPEQAELKPATPASDIFSLGVVAYEALTSRKPFARKTPMETLEAVRGHIPPPAREINPNVSQLVSKVVHKAMAKDPIHRFLSARDFADTLQKALLNQPIECFDPARIQPRIERARRAFAEGDYGFASEILTELGAEGHIDTETALLRGQIDEAVKQKKVRYLLESARTRMEQDEFPLALDKVREVLELEPGNADGLAMRAAIEQQRSAKQVDSWMGLARQHLERYDFMAARQALKEVLAIVPGHPLASKMLAEVDAKEQKAARVRAEKEQLYSVAMRAFRGGEISSALSKLERVFALSRQNPEAASEDRDAVYQSLYNQVRSERDAIHNGYEEARRCLAEKNFAKALDLADQLLAKYPDHALLQALRLETVEAERQELSAYIAEVGKRAEAEPDLDRRVNIFKEACDRYPNEPQFQQSLKLARERRDLIESIVARARQYEESGQLAEAIGQWDILRNIYPQYPGTEFEIAQLASRREQQAREDEKARLVEQIDRELEAGAYLKVRELALAALQDFPGDQELAGLERLARQALERSEESRRLFEAGQQACAEGEKEKGVGLLKSALEISAGDPAIREALMKVLVEQARALIDEDWRKAEPLVDQASDLDPNHPGVRSLRLIVAGAKRKDYVGNCLAQARSLQTDAGLQAALERVEAGLAAYPNEPRLLQYRTNLQNSIQDRDRRERRSEDASALRKLRQQVERNLPAAELGSIAAQAQEISDRYADDSEIRKIAGEIVQLAQPPAPQPLAPQPPPPQPAVEEFTSLNPMTEFPARPAAAAPPPPPPPPPPPETPRNEPAQPQPAPLMFAGVAPARRIKASYLIAAAAAMLVFSVILVGTLVFGPRWKGPQPQPVRTTLVRIGTHPADALVAIDGKRALARTLALAGSQSHNVTVSRLGYRTATGTGLRAESDWNFTLVPEPLHIRIVSSAGEGKVLLDGAEIGGLEDGDLPDYEMPPDSRAHTLTLKSRKVVLFTLQFEAVAGVRPQVAPFRGDGLMAVASLGPEATVYSGMQALKVAAGGRPPEAIPPQGLAIGGLTAASRELVFAGDRAAIPVDTGNAPVLYVSLKGNPNAGYAFLTSDAPGAQLWLDDVRIHPAKPGYWRVRRDPGSYRLKLAAPGFLDLSMVLPIAKGERVTQKLELRKPPVVATLSIDGGTPGAEVLLDDTRVGALDPSGAFRYDQVSPGERKVGLRKENFEPALARLAFTAGQTVSLPADQARLREFGSLRFEVAPAGAQLRYRGVDDRDFLDAGANATIYVKAGRYEIAASAPEHEGARQTVTVAPGKTTVAELRLNRIAAPAPKPEPTVADFISEPDRLLQDGEWTRIKDADPVFLRAPCTDFTLRFGKPAKDSKTRRLDLLIHFVSASDNITYEFDGRKIVRKALLNGKQLQFSQKMGGAVESATRSIRVRVYRNRVLITGEGESLLDDFKYEGEDLTTGKIGIRGEMRFVIRPRS